MSGECSHFETKFDPHSVVFKPSAVAETQKVVNVQKRCSGKGDISV